MDMQFDKEQAKKFLIEREAQEKEHDEQERLDLLAKVLRILKELFSNSDVEIYLVGSIIHPYKFHSKSDVDIVVKNYKGDRFDLWTKLESLIQKKVEVIIFENCSFQDHVTKAGYKVL
jgi:predicted nucleotidyltransferase